jgi:hypothetical protein
MHMRELAVQSSVDAAKNSTDRGCVVLLIIARDRINVEFMASEVAVFSSNKRAHGSRYPSPARAAAVI